MKGEGTLTAFSPSLFPLTSLTRLPEGRSCTLFTWESSACLQGLGRCLGESQMNEGERMNELAALDHVHSLVGKERREGRSRTDKSDMPGIVPQCHLDLG